jgi:hypothetical protein
MGGSTAMGGKRLARAGGHRRERLAHVRGQNMASNSGARWNFSSSIVPSLSGCACWRDGHLMCVAR